jgi:pfkB family carbohydrate kinase
MISLVVAPGPQVSSSRPDRRDWRFLSNDGFLSLGRDLLEEVRLAVVVVGNAAVDVAYQVEHLPGAGETVLARERAVDAGGKGLNQAIMARRAGAAVRFGAALGHDAAAGLIRARLEVERLSTGP